MGFHSYHHVRLSCWGLRKDCTAQVAFCAVEPLFMCCSVGLFHLFPLKLCEVCVWDLRGSDLEQPWKWGCLTFLLSPVLLPVDCTRKMSFGGPYVPYKKHLLMSWTEWEGWQNLHFVSEMLETLVKSCPQLIEYQRLVLQRNVCEVCMWFFGGQKACFSWTSA